MPAGASTLRPPFGLSGSAAAGLAVLTLSFGMPKAPQTHLPTCRVAEIAPYLPPPRTRSRTAGRRVPNHVRPTQIRYPSHRLGSTLRQLGETGRGPWDGRLRRGWRSGWLFLRQIVGRMGMVVQPCGMSDRLQVRLFRIDGRAPGPSRACRRPLRRRGQIRSGPAALPAAHRGAGPLREPRLLRRVGREGISDAEARKCRRLRQLPGQRCWPRSSRSAELVRAVERRVPPWSGYLAPFALCASLTVV